LLWALRGVGAVDGVDAATRWRTRLGALAGDVANGGAAVAATSVTDAATLDGALAGLTLTDAVATLASFDALDPRPAEVPA
jgi:hypothetical protein